MGDDDKRAAEWAEVARAVLMEVFPTALVWAREDGCVQAKWDWDNGVRGAADEVRWTFDDLQRVSDALGTRRINVVTEDSRGYGSEWTGPYGSLDVVIEVWPPTSGSGDGG